MASYQLVLSEAAARTFAQLSRLRQRQAGAALDEVKREPFREGDFRQRDPAGRINEVVLLGGWLVTYWTDHAVREIRVVALEHADEG